MAIRSMTILPLMASARVSHNECQNGSRAVAMSVRFWVVKRVTGF